MLLGAFAAREMTADKCGNREQGKTCNKDVVYALATFAAFEFVLYVPEHFYFSFSRCLDKCHILEFFKISYILTTSEIAQ